MMMAWIFRTVPRRKGLEMVLTGERISAVRAAEYGLINALSCRGSTPPAGTGRDPCEQTARSRAPGLAGLHHQDELAVREALPYLQDMLMQCFGTDDAREGLTAFLEKREPVWRGR